MSKTQQENRIAKLCRRSLPVAGAVAFGVGHPDDAHAELIVQDINDTVTDNDFVDIDLNEDGLDDYRLQVKSNEATIRGIGYSGNPHQVADIFGFQTNGLFYATPFSLGDVVGPDTGGLPDIAYLYDASGGGPFNDVGDTGFVGLRMEIDGSTHYGWLQLTRGSIQIGQAGFQTTGAGAPIQLLQSAVPEPSTLALLAAGAAGMAMLRRRRKES